MSETVERNAKRSAAPCAKRWLDLDKRAINRAGERSKDKVNALEGKLALLVGKSVAGNLLGEHHRRRSLAFYAWRK